MGKISFRWGIDVLDKGFTDIPNILLRNYAKAGVSRQEFLAIIHLASYQYEREGSQSFPSLDTIAGQMGYSRQGLCNVLNSLETKGLLDRTRRAGKTTIYDFSGFSNLVISKATEGVNPSLHPPVNHSLHPPVNPSLHEEQNIIIEKQEQKTFDPDGSSETCPDCGKPLCTSEQTPKLQDVCACAGEAALEAAFGDNGPANPVSPTESWAERLSQRPWLGWSDGRFKPRQNASVEAQERVAWILEDVTTRRPTEKEWKLWSSECAAIYEAARGDFDVIERGVKAAWDRESKYRPTKVAGFKGAVANAWAEAVETRMEELQVTAIDENLMARLPTA
jgi:hypothetical protein